MRLNEKTVKFTNQEGVEPTKEQLKCLELVVDGNNKGIKAPELFFGNPKINSGYIKGFSVLEQLQQTEKNVFNKLIISSELEPLLVSFIEPESGTIFYIKSIDLPFAYYDKDFTDEDIASCLQKFYNTTNEEALPASDDAPEDEDETKPTSPQGDVTEPSEGGSSEPEPESESKPEEESVPEPEPDMEPEPESEFGASKKQMIGAGYSHSVINGLEVFVKHNRAPLLLKVYEDGSFDEVNIHDSNLELLEDGFSVTEKTS